MRESRENRADLAWRLVVGEIDAAGCVGVAVVPDVPKVLRGSAAGDPLSPRLRRRTGATRHGPAVGGVGFDLNWRARVGVEGHVEMNLSAADCNNGVVVKVVHDEKYTGNARSCPVAISLDHIL